MAISKKIREIVFNKFGGKCSYCGCELIDKWQVDHAISKNYYWLIDPKNMDSVDCIDNLMPSCSVCNHYKRSHIINDVENIIGFRTYMKTFHKRLAKLPKKTGLNKILKRIEYMNIIATKYNITPDTPFNGVFYFETFINEKIK